MDFAWALVRPLSAAIFSAISFAVVMAGSSFAVSFFRQIRACLPPALKNLLHIESRLLTLRLPEGSDADVDAATAIVSQAMKDTDELPVIPREVEDILMISSGERHRWLKTGRLQSAGTRTVKVRGRARKITFHVFDPRHIEDVLDRDLVTVWRDEDAATAAQNRRRAAAKAAIKRAQKRGREPPHSAGSGRDESSKAKLRGSEDFESDGLLR
ncbi:MAG: hypothetical protein EOS41_28590 [Mesorhizobium sp.]|uniref:hypothetical protein n=1 Tax=Mesorhizobium sp. TaxID=1871066 RepID=UPI000FE59567|nr:hypothetical protein [Mesorhizobium sp.]RWE20486.1 MAG: hypothetical protein EOS41_28590 [Mesorhizobium sp.]